MDRTERRSPVDYEEHVPQGAPDQSVGELFVDLSRETFRLMRQELEFARLEVSRNVSKASRDTLFIVIGAAIVYAGFLSLLAAAVFGLTSFMPPSAAALLVGLIAVALGWLIVRVNRKKLREENLAPRKSFEALKGDKEWIKNRMM